MLTVIIRFDLTVVTNYVPVTTTTLPFKPLNCSSLIVNSAMSIDESQKVNVLKSCFKEERESASQRTGSASN